MINIKKTEKELNFLLKLNYRVRINATVIF
jgi:hypothetical protein